MSRRRGIGPKKALIPDPTRRRTPKVQHDPDARWAKKTKKGGGYESYYGYEIQAAVRTPDPSQEGLAEPTLVEAVEVTSARADTIPASIRLLDRLPERHTKKRLLVVDRAYNNWKEENWFIPLTARGFEQVVDMREGHRGRKQAHGMVFIDGWPHCPRVPEGMENLRAPGIGATAAQWESFHRAIERRRAYAMTFNGRGIKARAVCPAAGDTPSVGCPLRRDTVELAQRRGLPVVADPPPVEFAPSCCTAGSVTLSTDAWGRTWQRYYWGSREWRQAFKRRTRVEQFFGQAKSKDGEGMTRGFFRVTGLARVNFAVACVSVVRNVKALENWTKTHGDSRDPGNPLLQPDEPSVILHLTLDELTRFDLWRENGMEAMGAVFRHWAESENQDDAEAA
jgi:hypothetical protein